MNNNFREGLNALREISDPEKMKMALEKIAGKKLADYEGIDALVGALMGYYNGELKKKLNTDEINEKLKNFCPFPVNSLYLSLGNENPSSLWLGTTWQKQEGRFLLGSSSSYNLGSTGGSNNIKLSVDNLPAHTHSASTASHSHSQPAHSHGTRGTYASSFGLSENRGDNFGGGNLQQGSGSYNRETYSAGGENTGSASPVTSIGSTGNGNSINIMPPYLAVNIWKRLS